MGRDRDDSTAPPSSHASQAQLYAAAAVSTAAGNRPSATGVDPSPTPPDPSCTVPLPCARWLAQRDSVYSACSLSAAAAMLVVSSYLNLGLHASPMPVCPQSLLFSTTSCRGCRVVMRSGTRTGATAASRSPTPASTRTLTRRPRQPPQPRSDRTPPMRGAMRCALARTARESFAHVGRRSQTESPHCLSIC